MAEAHGRPIGWQELCQRRNRVLGNETRSRSAVEDGREGKIRTRHDDIETYEAMGVRGAGAGLPCRRVVVGGSPFAAFVLPKTGSLRTPYMSL